MGAIYLSIGILILHLSIPIALLPVRGMMYYRQALEVQCFLEAAEGTSKCLSPFFICWLLSLPVNWHQIQSNLIQILSAFEFLKFLIVHHLSWGLSIYAA